LYHTIRRQPRDDAFFVVFVRASGDGKEFAKIKPRFRRASDGRIKGYGVKKWPE
jgi:hypothetical protein